MCNTAISYARFSTIEQLKGDSLRRQVEATRLYCGQHGLELDESLTLRDLGVSAFKSKNRKSGALGTFLAAVEEGRVKPGSTLIVESFDRLSRDAILNALSLFTQIVQSGVAIVTLMDQKKYTVESVNANPFDLMYSLTIMARSHEESVTKSKRVSAAAERRRNQIIAGDGGAFQGKRPAWLRIEGGKFHVIPERAAVVKRVLMLAIGGMGSRMIAKRLNSDRVPPWGANAYWTIGMINHITRTKSTIGTIETKTGDGVGYYPAIITEEMFYKMQAAMQQRRKSTARGRTGANIANLFGDLLISGFDGTRMWVVTKNVARFESMKAVTANAKDKGDHYSFPVAAFERSFLEWVTEVNIQPPAPDDRTEEIAGRLAEVRSKIEVVNKQMNDASGDQFPRLVELLKKLDGQESALLAEQEQATTQQHATTYSTTDIRKLVVSMGGKDKEAIRAKLRMAISSVVKQIKLYPFRRKGTNLAIAIVELSNGTFRVFGVMCKHGGHVVTLSTGVPTSSANVAPDVIASAVLDVATDLKGSAFDGDDTPAIKDIRKAFAAGYVASVTKKK